MARNASMLYRARSISFCHSSVGWMSSWATKPLIAYKARHSFSRVALSLCLAIWLMKRRNLFVLLQLCGGLIAPSSADLIACWSPKSSAIFIIVSVGASCSAVLEYTHLLFVVAPFG